METEKCPTCGGVASRNSLHALLVHCTTNHKRVVQEYAGWKRDLGEFHPRVQARHKIVEKWASWAEKLEAMLADHDEPTTPAASDPLA